MRVTVCGLGSCGNMGVLLPLLCALGVARVHGVFEGTCVRKDPPPGVLVLLPGSKLVLTCRGHVMVNGLTVNLTKNSSAAPTAAGNSINKHPVGSAANLPQSNSGATAVTGGNRYTDTGATASPTAPRAHQTAVSRPPKAEPTRTHEEKSGEDDYDEEDEEEEGNRVTRGTNRSPQWKWKWVGAGMREWRDVSVERREPVLSLPSVGPADSGSYACRHRGKEMFSLQVIVADPPESPSLSCYKKSPSSKLRCESETRKPPVKPFSCHLALNKRPSDAFQPRHCSYSHKLSRYWCALEHDEDKLRTVHTAYMCVTSITGSVTSSLLSFTPLQILKPDPPSSVRIFPVEGRQTFMRVTWSSPLSWKSQNNYYKLIYEVKYRPRQSSDLYEQKRSSRTMKSELTDVMPGVEYQVQVRAKDEYDGRWSDWSEPVINRSWTEPTVPTTPQPTTAAEEGSAFTSEGPTVMVNLSVCAAEGETQVDKGSEVADPTSPEPVVEKASYHALWISGSFLLLSVILGFYIFRLKDRFMPKLHHLIVISQHDDSPQPPAPGPAAPEMQGLVTFAPRCCKEHQQSNTEEEAEEEHEEEQHVEDKMEAVHFNNTSYFLLQNK